MKTKILMINTVPMIYDGIGTVILNYATNIDHNNMDVDFVVINHLDDKMRSQISSINGKIYELTERNKSPLKYIIKLRQIVKNGKYDIVHIHCNSCTVVVDLLGAKLGGAKLLCPHSHNTKCLHVTAHKILRPFFNMLYTDGFACGILAGKWLYHNRKFVVLRNATDTDKYRFNEKDRERIRNQYNLKNKVAVGHVAHFTYQKNHRFLIETFVEVVKRNPKFVLFLIGDGELRGEIEQLVNKYKLNENIIFTGTILDIPSYLSAMDMMVLPSLWEGLPNVAIEWQTSGLPTLVSSTVTSDCKLTDSVSFLPLDKNTWVEAMLGMNIDIDRKIVSEINIEKIREAGYSIKEEAAKLKNYYLSHLKK